MHPHVSDFDLLREYLDEHSHDAFARIVGRYVDLIYSSAKRQLKDGHLAQDVTQQVFLVLIAKSNSIRRETILASWLLTATTYECRNALKGEARRLRREQKVAEMSPHTPSGIKTDTDWEAIAPHLDAALDELSAGDRDAVVLRYLQRRSYRDAAAVLGTSEGSVRQRVHRGIDKMRAFFAARGVTAEGTALIAAMAKNGVQAAPAGLKGAILAATARASARLAGAAGTAGFMSTVLAKALMATAAVAISVLIVAVVSRHSREVVVRDSAGPTPVIAPPSGGTVLGANGAVVMQRTPQPLRRLFQLIPANSCNASKGTSDGNDRISFIQPGDWLRFNDVDLGTAGSSEPLSFCAAVACPAEVKAGTIQVHLDKLDGPLIATLNIQPTGSSNQFVSQLAPVNSPRGAHDLFVEFTGGGFSLQSIQFLQTGRSAFLLNSAQSFYVSEKTLNRGDVLCEIHDGAWARYDGLDFGAGADAFTANYAVDAEHAGGSIIVRIDSRDGAVLCEVPLEPTGNWGTFVSHTAKHQLLQGRHNVFLTFSGGGKVSYMIANVKWFVFDGPGAKTMLAPPSAVASQPAAEGRAP
jgi:RNA polymerase sigma factor (sigma-70 family)